MKLSNILATPSSWTSQYDEVEEIDLCSSSTEYLYVKSKLSGISLAFLERITRIQNPYLYHRYQIRKLEYERLGFCYPERELVHATAAFKIPSIIENNLDWRMASRVKFGKGVSFSTSPDYANKQCCRSNGLSRAMILAKVLVGNSCAGSSFTSIPSKGCDTTTGNGSFVLVKYYDDEFYPAYVAYYSDLPNIRCLRLRYN